MPIYEYRCERCGHELEKMQKINDPPLIDCPECGEPALKKQISAAGFRLKGSGWYETDFKGGAKKNLHGAERGDKKEAKASTSSSDTKSDGGKGGDAGAKPIEKKPAAKPGSA